MGIHRTLFLLGLAPWLILAAAGCALPAWMHMGDAKPHSAGPNPPPPPGHPGPNGQGGFGVGWPSAGPANPLGGGPPGPGGAPGQFNEQIALMSQRLANTEDDKKALNTRLRQLENQLRDKDRALMQASFEIQEATGQIGRTREELNRWKQEMETLRGKLRNVENDNKTTLEAIIRTLEQFLDREKLTSGQMEPMNIPAMK